MNKFLENISKIESITNGNIMYQPTMILENGQEATLGKPCSNKIDAQQTLDKVKEQAEKQNPDRFPNLAFYIAENKQ